MKKFMQGVVVALLLLHPAGPGWAARPLTVDDAGTVEAGTFELEVGYEYEDFVESCQGISLGIKHGITEKMDFGVGTGWQLDPENGPEALELGVKWSILSAKERNPGVSFIFDFAPGETEYSLNGVLSQPVGGKLTLHFNAGYNVPDALADGVALWGGAFEFTIREDIHLMGEILGEEDLSDEDADRRSWLLGGNAAVTEFLTLDVGGGTEISSDPGWFVSGGATVGF